MGPWNFDAVLQQCPNIVTAEMNQTLNAEITMEEVHNAVFQMGPLKAPGSDGLNGQFYQHHWEDIKQGVFD